MLMLITMSNDNGSVDKYFNTSHVNVNQHQGRELVLLLLHFNTSHVNVNPESDSSSDPRCNISIHLMLMLILTKMAIQRI